MGSAYTQTNLIAGVSSYQAPAMDTERALYERRPISSYSKMNIHINGAGPLPLNVLSRGCDRGPLVPLQAGVLTAEIG
jgi:hypothetical protein